MDFSGWFGYKHLAVERRTEAESAKVCTMNNFSSQNLKGNICLACSFSVFYFYTMATKAKNPDVKVLKGQEGGA